MFTLLCTVLLPLLNLNSVNIYLLRGIGREAAHWSPEFLNRLKMYYPSSKLILLDLPGAGKFFQLPAKWSIPAMAEFLEEAYQDSLGKYTGTNYLMASSLAGNVALEWVSRYPDNFSGLALVGSSLKGVCIGKKRVQPDAKKGFVDIFLTHDIADREAKFLAINSNLHTQDDSLLMEWIHIQKLRRVRRATLLRQTVAGMIYRGPRYIPQIPIAVMGSESDKIVHPDCICKVSDHLHADLFMHPTSGHGIPIDAPIWLADSFAQWIEKQSPKDTPALLSLNPPTGVWPELKNWVGKHVPRWTP